MEPPKAPSPFQGIAPASRPKDKTAAFGMYLCAFSIVLLIFIAPLQVSAQTTGPGGSPTASRAQICQMIEAVAQKNRLPTDFFVRVIWQESRFHADAIGPSTRNGEHAEGIAQFMPGTATARNLFEPFNPGEALPKSGQFLAELLREFGNLGLAAAAYNAGPQRVHDFLGGSHELPLETRNYVLAITGQPVENWIAPVNGRVTAEYWRQRQSNYTPTNCRDLVTLLARMPDPLLVQWRGRKVPSWCKGLSHPNFNVCGPVHLIETKIPTAGVSVAREGVHLSRRLD
jgi:Transglycosylase SLT domain